MRQSSPAPLACFNVARKSYQNFLLWLSCETGRWNETAPF
jgi:hypothetical protein